MANVDDKMIMAINELSARTGKSPVMRSLPGLPDFEFDAIASGFELPADEAEKDALAAAWLERVEQENVRKV